MGNTNDNSGTDPLYSKVMAESGNMVSGGAALLVRSKAVDGPSKLIEIAVKAALDASNAAVHQKHRKKLRVVS
ncbi:hypothetical protein CRM93_12990 [Acetobacter fabarum]|uniref:Uncharacterized protein n=1 Tax=Acetobacter fabarum TaxID=483199 RepID=A0A269XPN6_9PROT|nr:hypothetical protein B8X00_13550 [Acetobacter fabarum]PEN22662.1 hypothetical protein CRM93_12990 [Acetobacter fabarum]